MSAKHRRGHGVHSPFVFDFIRKVLVNEDNYPSPEKALAFQNQVKSDSTQIEIKDLGAGSRVTNSKKRTVRSLAARSSVSKKQGIFLNRLVQWYNPTRIIEFGTGLGISTSFLGAGRPGIPLVTVEGSREKLLYAKNHAAYAGIEHASFIESDFDTVEESLVGKCKDRTLIFIDGDHRSEVTYNRVRAFLTNKDATNMLLVLDDIYWSSGMETAWRSCIALDDVAISMDLFHFGILFKRPDIAKQHFKVFF